MSLQDVSQCHRLIVRHLQTQATALDQPTALGLDTKGVLYQTEGCGMVLLISSQKQKAATEKQGANAMVNTWILATMAKAVKQKGMKYVMLSCASSCAAAACAAGMVFTARRQPANRRCKTRMPACCAGTCSLFALWTYSTLRQWCNIAFGDWSLQCHFPVDVAKVWA